MVPYKCRPHSSENDEKRCLVEFHILSIGHSPGRAWWWPGRSRISVPILTHLPGRNACNDLLYYVFTYHRWITSWWALLGSTMSVDRATMHFSLISGNTTMSEILQVDPEQIVGLKSISSREPYSGTNQYRKSCKIEPLPVRRRTANCSAHTGQLGILRDHITKQHASKSSLTKPIGRWLTPNQQHNANTWEALWL